jgi:SAM-dependent methyltransferase
MDKSAGLISHGGETDASSPRAIASIKARLRAGSDLPAATLEKVLSLVDQLAEFELGRFMLVNRGLDAQWIHRIVTYRPGSLRAGAVPDLEYQVFENLPLMRATRERFGIFQTLLQERITPGSTLASVPCGWMGDLLLLDYAHCPDVRLMGIDLDPQALDGARALAAERGLGAQLSLHLADAWKLDLYAVADTLTSNGLDVYESDDARVAVLYRKFHDALKPDGLLVASFLTPPPGRSAASPWDAAAIDPDALALQHLLFAQVIGVKWRNYHTYAQMREQLQHAGFVDIRFIDDRARMYPTVTARKRC